MIPKIIHYCWLSNDPMPSLIENCLNSWDQHLKDYEIIFWNKDRADKLQSKWVNQAYENKKYAFAADYIRLYAIYHYGGIYMDTDIEVLKPFDKLLDLPYFIGTEGKGIVEAGVFGAEAKSDWIKNCLEYYHDREFINNYGEMDTTPLPGIMMRQIQKTRNISLIPQINDTTIDLYQNPKQLLMLPHDYFCAKDGGTGIVTTTEDTFCIHHFAMSWIPARNRFLTLIKHKLISIIGIKPVYKLIDWFHLKKIKITNP